MNPMFFKKVIPGSTSRLAFIDHNETYGRHILEKHVKNISISACIDIGCGGGNDLSIVKKYHPNSKLFGIDYGSWSFDRLRKLGITPTSLDIEKGELPFEYKSVDFVIANQVLEHTKEVFWINHEIFRCLKVGGYFFMGVPNILSLHNRVLMAMGYHPTCNKLTSAHVRVFSKHDVYSFYHYIGNHFCKIEHFHGSQFYPLPKVISRFISLLLPSLALTSFYLIKKTGEYKSEFIDWPKHAELETNYYTGSQKIP